MAGADARSEKMMVMLNRNLSRRLERLEERSIEAGEPLVLEVCFVKPDRTQAPGGFTVTVPAAGLARDRRAPVDRSPRRSYRSCLITLHETHFSGRFIAFAVS